MDITTTSLYFPTPNSEHANIDLTTAIGGIRKLNMITPSVTVKWPSSFTTGLTLNKSIVNKGVKKL
jgi:hypothetical protein